MADKDLPAIFDLDDNGEANGTVHPYCSDHCCDQGKTHNYPDDKLYRRGTTTLHSHGAGTICEWCEEPLDRKE